VTTTTTTTMCMLAKKPLASTRWCDIEASDDDDEYADMGSLVGSSDDDRPNELLFEETDDEEEVAPITTDPITAAPGVPPPWSLVGRIDPKPVKMTRQGVGSIFDLLQKVHMVPSARKAVTGDGVCIGLTFKTCPFMHPKTQRNRELVAAVVAEIRSHKELRDICFTSIQINHNTISAPHTDSK
jgi:hypothetical protein